MPRFVHLNGPPGIGKSTLAARYVAERPGALNLDVDGVHRLVGGWQDEENRTWQVVWPLVRAMAAAQLAGGREVVLPQYLATPEEIGSFEELARAHGAEFREVVLLDSREASAARFERRARASADEWVRYHHRLVGQRGGAELLGAMYDNLVEVLRSRPDAVVVPSAAGEVAETFALLVEALA
ncbi:putative kinase [Crossiella equi]|uniref:Kinase n=1 Tax=Crossiella equi TaxID=130796 RepID=A0ABS5ASP1_9PSEU|nr:AAA family ATPase [Crossiella equi]MBP2479237.1 putative kinase [Crossiella equi]